MGKVLEFKPRERIKETDFATACIDGEVVQFDEFVLVGKGDMDLSLINCEVDTLVQASYFILEKIRMLSSEKEVTEEDKRAISSLERQLDRTLRKVQGMELEAKW